MYLRTVTSKTKSGMREYLQLCHNYREDGGSRTDVLYSFGRKDQVDQKQIRRLINSLANLLPEDERMQIQAETDLGKGFEYMGSRHLGGIFFLDQIWKRLQIDKTLIH